MIVLMQRLNINFRYCGLHVLLSFEMCCVINQGKGTKFWLPETTWFVAKQRHITRTWDRKHLMFSKYVQRRASKHVSIKEGLGPEATDRSIHNATLTLTLTTPPQAIPKETQIPATDDDGKQVVSITRPLEGYCVAWISCDASVNFAITTGIRLAKTSVNSSPLAHQSLHKSLTD